jgi:hypothetical protein
VIGTQANPLDMAINEVAWAGTLADPNDEWIELRSNRAFTISLSGWRLRAGGGVPDILLNGTIAANGYYLLERTDDSTVSDVPADQIYTGALPDSGETLFLLDPLGTVIDTANGNGGGWPGGSAFPNPISSMERIVATAPDSDANWGSNDGITRNGRDADGNPINGTPRQPNSLTPPTPAPGHPLISEVLYDGTTPTTDGDEFVEICNPCTATLDLTDYKIGDEETAGGSEGMYFLPVGTTLAPDACLVIAKNAAQFAGRFGFLPDYELVTGGAGYTDSPTVPNLARYTGWASGSWALADSGDEVLLLDPADMVVDAVAYGGGAFSTLGLRGRATAPSPKSLQRVWPYDSDDMSADFLRAAPNPGILARPPPPPASPPPAAPLPDGLWAFWGSLHVHSAYGDGAGPPVYALPVARANGLHFLGLADHSHLFSDTQWADMGVQIISATVDGAFVGLRGFEWAHPTDGHVVVFGTSSYVSRDAPAYNTLAGFYGWLAGQSGAVGGFHRPSAASDFLDFAYEPAVAGAMGWLEVGSGVAPYYRFEEAYLRALARGWHLAPANNSDTATVHWGADTPHRTGIVAPALTQADLLAALRARRVFATEDSNLALALRCGAAWMGSSISHTAELTFTVDFYDVDNEPLTLTLYDRAAPVAWTAMSGISGTWPAKAIGAPGHYYFVKAVQGDGDLAYSAPIRMEGTASPDRVTINEFLPAPHDVDWDGDGVADSDDEWIELYSAEPWPVGLGGYRLTDAGGATYEIPFGLVIPPKGFLLFHHRQTRLALNNDGDTINLIRPDGTLADSVSYTEEADYDRSWCRSVDGDGVWTDQCIETPGAPNKLRPYEGRRRVSIAKARSLPADKWVAVVGRVTVPPPLFGQDTMYIQDDTAGIRVHVSYEPFPALALGDKVLVYGRTWDYHGERELRVYSGADVQFREPGAPLAPLPVNSAGVAEANEGLLVQVMGRAVGLGQDSFHLDDGSGEARVVLLDGTGISRPDLEGEEQVTVAGVVSQYSENRPYLGGYRLLPRYPTDLVLPLPELLIPVTLPETGAAVR